MALRRGIFVVAGYGNGSGTGAHSAFQFAKAGYKVALLGRRAPDLEKGVETIKTTGGEAAAFPLKDYGHDTIAGAFESIKKQWPNESIRVALWNAGYGVWKPFLEVTPEEWKESTETNILAPAAFSKAAILAFKDLELNEEGARGTLLFTGATASIRGNKTTSAFAAGKFGLRALSHSLAKEFGKQNIHVVHAIIDGGILTDRGVSFRGEDWAKDEDVRLNPEALAKTYVFLAHQHRSTWTWELDVRPAHENW